MNDNDRAITGLVMLAHSLVHTYEFAFPVFVPIWLSQFGATEAAIGLALTVGFSLFGLGSLPAGILADRRGSKALIVACLVGMGGSFLLLSLAPAASPWNLAVVTLALVVWGVSASVYHPAGLSLLTRGVEERGSAFAYHGTAGNIGTAMGPLLTTILLFALTDDWRLVAALLALPALAGVLLAVRIDVNETAAVAADGGEDGGSKANPGVDSLGEFLSVSRTLFTGAFLAVFAAVMLSGLYYRGTLTFLPALFEGFEAIQPVEAFGRTFEPGNYIYTGLLATGVLGQYAGGKLTDHIPVELGLALGYGGLGVIALVYLPAANAGLLPLLVLSAVLGFFLFVVQPFYQATVAEYTPPSARGLSYGFTYLGVFGVGALGATVAGVALTEFSPPTLFAVLSVFGFVAGGLGLLLLTRAR
ncbi:MFS transporter [Halomarina litorea]|uniref:MFS transporter n=1 Tax=Halomarina litorea TaxID=2961595 RepID=UPI0020C43610|nr:MFS transporter [Halomarina sp. BCD28]